MPAQRWNPAQRSGFQPLRTDTADTVSLRAPSRLHSTAYNEPRSMAATAKPWDTPQQPRFQNLQRNSISDSMPYKHSPSRFNSSSLGIYRAPITSKSIDDVGAGERRNPGRYGPDREKMKNDLAYSNSIAKSSIPGVGILPGFGDEVEPRTTGRRQYHNSFPNPRSDLGSSNSPYYPSRQSIVRPGGGNEIESTRSSTTTMSRAQEAINNLRSTVSKANDMAHDDNASFQEKVNNMEKRQRQNTYREELERQIQATKHSKDMEKRKNEVHPLGPKYDVPGLSHWHQSSTTVIPPEKASAIAKLLLEKSTSSSSKLNQYQSPENDARKEAALENLRKARQGTKPNLFQANNATSNNNYSGNGIAAASNNNNNFPSQTQLHPAAPAFRTNSSLSTQRLDIPPSNPQQNYNNSSQNMGTNSNYNQNQPRQIQYHQQQSNLVGNSPIPPQDMRDSTPNQYQGQPQSQPQRPPSQVHYPPNPMGYGQPVQPVSYPPNGYGPGPWSNPAMMQQPYPSPQPGYYPPPVNPYNHPQQYPKQQYPQQPYALQQQPQPQRMVPPSPAYPGYFQSQNERPPNVQRPTEGQYQHTEPRQQQVQQQQQRHFNFNTEDSREADANINRRPQPKSIPDSELQKIVSNYRMKSCDPADIENKPLTDFMTAEERIEFERLKDEVSVQQKSWQMSEDLPDPALKHLVYKVELRQQIHINNARRLQKLKMDAAADAKIEQDIEAYNNKPRRNRSNEYANRILQAEKDEYLNQERWKNPEITLAKKLENREDEHLGDGDRRQKQPFRLDNGENDEPIKLNTKKRDLPRKWSPPVPAIQRQLEYSNDFDHTPKRRSNVAKKERKLGLDLDFMNKLQSEISSERQRVERSLREKLDTTTNGSQGYGY